MLSTSSECKATTDIQEFEGQIERACGERIQSVSLTGSHERARYVITFAVDLEGMQIAETVTAQQAWHAAVTSHEILNGVYPMKRFEYSMKDTNGKAVCDFVFEGDERKPVQATCMSEVR
jgi:hypothetical protein